MRICYLANSAIPHTAKWARYFAEIGHEVHVISHSKTDIEGVNMHYINYNMRNFLSKLGEVHRLIDKIKPDVLHAHQANTCGFYGVTKKDYKVIVSAWGSDILVAPQSSFIMKKVVQHVLKKAHLLTSDSSYMSEKMVELGADADKLYTFPMGIEEELLKYKREFDEGDRVKFISTRRLEKIYRIDLIIKGFAEALKVRDNIELTIAADGGESDSLKKLAEDLGVSDRIRFTGRYKADEVGKLLMENDVFVSIPESDATSVSLLEAMGCGLFPLVSDLPANREWVNDRENGIIVKKHDENSVKDAILWCCENKNVLKNASDKNVDIIKEKALWKNNAKIVEGLYEKLK